MSVVDTDSIDAIGLDKKAKRIFLTIIDPLLWDSENVHLFTLQEKINTYLHFVDSGELVKALPDGEGFDIAIELILKHMPTDEAISFFDQTMQLLFDRGIVFVFGPNKETGYAEQQS